MQDAAIEHCWPTPTRCSSTSATRASPPSGASVAHAPRAPLLSVGPSSVVQALATQLAASTADAGLRRARSGVRARRQPVADYRAAGRGRVIVPAVSLDAARLADPAVQWSSADRRALRDGHHVIAHTATADAASAGRPPRVAGGALLRGLRRRAADARRDGRRRYVESRGEGARHWGLSYLRNLSPGVALCRRTRQRASRRHRVHAEGRPDGHRRSLRTADRTRAAELIGRREPRPLLRDGTVHTRLVWKAAW